MLNSSIKVILLFICGIVAVNTELLSGVEKCKFGDNVCITKQINSILSNYPNGEKTTQFASLNPIKFKNMHLQQGKEGPVPVNIDLTVNDGIINGAESCTFTKTAGFGKDIKGPHTVYFTCPKQEMIGNYTIDGKILVLPIKGNGAMNLTTVDMSAALRFEGKPLEKNGKIFLDILKPKTKMNIKRLYMNFSNLFNDKALSDNMNTFLNENWEVIWSDLADAIQTSLGKIHASVVKSVFDNTPYNELFLNE